MEDQQGLGFARIAALAAVLAAAVLVGFVLFGGGNGYQVTARFLNAGQLVKGNVVQIGGVPAGSVESIKITPDGRADVKLTDRGATSRPCRWARARWSSSSRCRASPTASSTSSRATVTAPKIDNGGRIGPDDTDVAVEIDEIFDLFDPVARVAVQDFLKGSRKMIEGRGQQLNRGTKYLNPVPVHVPPAVQRARPRRGAARALPQGLVQPRGRARRAATTSPGPWATSTAPSAR